MRPRWPGVASRMGAAVFGGYALANLLAMALAALLGAPPADAVLVGMLWTYAFYTGAVLWAFAARSAWHAWAGLLCPAAALALLLLAPWGRGA